MENYIFIIIGIFINGLVGLSIGQARGRAIGGFFLGLVLGPIGWVLILGGPNPKREKFEKKIEGLLQHSIELQREQLELLKRK